ncbi:MAG: Rab family GTPase [Candidatus Hodarchaeota archaeon]
MQYKIVLAGDEMVGKTTLINRFITGSFKKEYKATIGVDIFTKRLLVMDQEVNLQIWDIAGQTTFRKFRERFFAGSKGALLVYDLTMPKSLNNLHLSWITDIETITGEIPLVLIGNKVDLDDLIAVTSKDIGSFLGLHPNIASHYNTSALTGENVERSFHELVFSILSMRSQRVE